MRGCEGVVWVCGSVCVCVCGWGCVGMYVCVCVCVCVSISVSCSRHEGSQFYVLSVREKGIKDFTMNDSTVSRIECVVHFAMNY